MRTNDKMSQSAVAVNSATSNVVNSNNYFSILKRVDGSYRSVPTTDIQDLWNNIFALLKEDGKDVYISVKRDDFKANFSLGKFNTYYITKNINGEYKTIKMVDIKVLRGKNINLMAHAILEVILDEYNEYMDNKNVEISKNEDATINESPCLEDTPCLEDDITDTGLSVAGLKYVEEKLGDMSEDSFQMMVDDAMTELLEDKYTMERIYFENYGVKHFVQEELVENLWVNLWQNLMGVTDEALEYETREYLKYDEYMDDLLESGAWAMCSNGYGAVHFNEDLACGAEDDSRLMELVGEYIAETEIEKIMRELDDESGAYKFEWGFFSNLFMERIQNNGNYEEYVKVKIKEEIGVADILLYDDALYMWTEEEPMVNKSEVKIVA